MYIEAFGVVSHEPISSVGRVRNDSRARGDDERADGFCVAKSVWKAFRRWAMCPPPASGEDYVWFCRNALAGFRAKQV